MELTCLCGVNNETYCFPFEGNETFSSKIESCSLLPLFLKTSRKVMTTTVYGISMLLVNLFLYWKARKDTTGPPSFFPLSNIGLCSIFFAIVPTIKYYLRVRVLVITGQIGCRIYALIIRGFVLLLPLSMLQMLYECVYGKLIVGNFKLKLKISTHIWIFVLCLAFPGVLMMDFSDEDWTCNVAMLMNSEVLHIFYELLFWFVASISPYLILILVVYGLKNKKEQLERCDKIVKQMLTGRTVQPGRRSQLTRCILWFLICFIVFLVARECYLLMSRILGFYNLYFDLTDLMMNGFERDYYTQLALALVIFLVIRKILCNENLDPMPHLNGWAVQAYLLRIIEIGMQCTNENEQIPLRSLCQCGPRIGEIERGEGNMEGQGIFHSHSV